MEQKNKKRMLKIIGMVSLIALAGCAEDDPQTYINEGNSLYKQGDIESARVQYQTALQINPKMAEAHYGMALIAEKKQNWPAMFTHLTDAESIDPTMVKAKVKLGQYFLLRNEIDKAKKYAEESLKLKPDDLAALTLDAAISFRQGQADQALQKLTGILERDENNTEAIGLKATVLAETGKLDQALKVTHDAIARMPDDKGLKFLRIRLNTELKNYPEVIADFEDLVNKNPHDKELQNVQIDWMTNIGQQDKALALLQKMIQQYPEDIDLKIKHTEILARKNAPELETTLQQYIQQHPDNYSFQYQLAQYYRKTKQPEKQQAILLQLVKQDPSGKYGLMAQVDLVELKLAAGEQAEAKEQIRQILSVDKNNSQALFVRAGLRLQEADIDGAISDLRIVLRDRPDYVPAMNLMADAYMVKKDKEIAESYWRKALELHPANSNALVKLNRQLLQRKDYDGAEKIITRALKNQPDSTIVLEQQIQLNLALKDWDSAQKAIDKLARNPQTGFIAGLWKSRMAIQKGENDKAVSILKELLTKTANAQQTSVILQMLAGIYNKTASVEDYIQMLQQYIHNHPQNQQIYLYLGNLYTRLRRWDEAEKILLQGEKIQPDNLAYKLVLARFYSQANKQQQAVELLSNILTDKPQSREAEMARLQLAQIYMQQGENDKASALLQQQLQKSPDNIQALMLRAALNAKNNNTDAAIKDLTAVISKNRRNIQARTQLASLYLQQQNHQAAQRQWREILQIDPQNQLALQQLAQSLYQHDQKTQAKELLQKAFNNHPQNTAISNLLVQQLLSEKDWAGVEKVIQRIKQNNAEDSAGYFYTARLASARGEYQQAVEACKKILLENPRNNPTLLELVKNYQKLGDTAGLHAFLTELIDKYPTVLEPYNALAAVYLSEKQWQKAENILKQALKKTTGSVISYQLLADTLEKQGKDAKVEKLYQKAINKHQDDLTLNMDLARFYEQHDELEKSIAVYEKLIKKYPKQLEVVNNLADLLVSVEGANQQNIKRALQLVKPFKDSNNPVLLDTYGWVMLKAGDYSQAVTVLQKVVSMAPDMPGSHYRLARAYQKAGQMDKARAELEKSLELAQKNGKFRDIEQAETLLKKLM